MTFKSAWSKVLYINCKYVIFEIISGFFGEAGLRKFIDLRAPYLKAKEDLFEVEFPFFIDYPN